MGIKWIKTAHRGLRYYEHQERKHGKQRDRYYAIRFKVGGTDYDYGVGWLSDGIPDAILEEESELGFQDYCLKLLRQYKGNVKTGLGPRSPKEARAIREEKREQAEQERIQTEKENITFGAFFTETYLPQSKQDNKSGTYAGKDSMYRLYLAGIIGSLSFCAIAPFHIERIKKTMSDKGKAPRTIEGALQLTRSVFNTARKLGIYAGESPTKAVKWPNPDNAKMRYLSIEESETLLKALAAKSKDCHDMALLSLHCGLRFGEIAVLTWSCVNLKAGALAILNAKTGSRTAYLTERAKEMLKNRKQSQPNEPIFPKRYNKNDGLKERASKTFSRTVKELNLNLGITDRKMKITFHTLRHTYATHLYEATHDLYLTQKMLGHKTGIMTARYAKMSENRLREGAAALDKAFSANEKKESDQIAL